MCILLPTVKNCHSDIITLDDYVMDGVNYNWVPIPIAPSPPAGF